MWPFYSFVWPFMVFHGFVSPFLAVIDLNSFSLVQKYSRKMKTKMDDFLIYDHDNFSVQK